MKQQLCISYTQQNLRDGLSNIVNINCSRAFESVLKWPLRTYILDIATKLALDVPLYCFEIVSLGDRPKKKKIFHMLDTTALGHSRLSRNNGSGRYNSVKFEIAYCFICRRQLVIIRIDVAYTIFFWIADGKVYNHSYHFYKKFFEI